MKTLEITSYIGCPNMCSYCPQELLSEAYKGERMMPLSDFSRVLDNVPKDVRIDFSGFSEIFCHSEGSKFILIAFERGYSIVLYTTLVGITENDFRVLSGVNFAEVVFHQYPGYFKEVFERDSQRFSQEIQPGRIAEITPQWLWSRAGNVFDRQRELGPFQCSFAARDFDHNVVLPNGDVVLCCQDYGLKHKLGNLFDTNFNDLNRVSIKASSLLDDSDCICRKCEIVQKVL